jgi:hypothetical protein
MKMAALGFFDDQRVELLDGELYRMTVNPPHSVATGLVAALLPVFLVRTSTLACNGRSI